MLLKINVRKKTFKLINVTDGVKATKVATELKRLGYIYEN